MTRYRLRSCPFCGSRMMKAGARISRVNPHKRKQMWECSKCHRRTVNPITDVGKTCPAQKAA